MTHRWARTFVSVAAAAMLSVTMLGGAGQPAAAKEPKLSGEVIKSTLALETAARVWLNPVAKTASVSFGKLYKSRVVTLQTRTTSDDAAAWKKAGKATKLSSSGKATFTLSGIYDSVSYRAVVDKTSSKIAKASSPTTLAAQWATTLNEGFTSSSLGAGAMWVDRGVNDQLATRLCSVPSSDPNVRSVTDGKLITGVAKYKSGTFYSDIVAKANAKAAAAYEEAMAAAKKLSRSKRAAAEKAAKAARKAVYGCPNGVFKNTAITTGGNSSGFTVDTAKPGILTARITFPKAQGMHGSLWLQSTDGKGGEIDFIESFGFGSGITSYVHVPKKSGGFTKVGGYVLTSKKNNKSWWAKAHDYSIEWTASTFTFRVDGAITRTIKRTLPNASYDLVASLLTSDWELGRLLKPVGKGVRTSDVSKQKMVVHAIRVWTKP